NSASASVYSSDAGIQSLLDWIKIVTTSAKSPVGNLEKDRNAQICRSPNQFQNPRRKTKEEKNEGHTQIRERYSCASSLTANKHLHHRVIHTNH
ncbi:MAG: hypothetical protein EAZ96_21260, partial [Oscillatoriales cyanobacterium]